MNKKQMSVQVTEELPDKKGIVSWIKEHKAELLFAGISLTALLLTIVGIKNKEELLTLWQDLKKRLEKGAVFSSKWFEKANLDELQEARDLVQQDCLNPNLDLDYRDECINLRNLIDRAISNRRWQGKEYGYPVHTENGWHLHSKD